MKKSLLILIVYAFLNVHTTSYTVIDPVSAYIIIGTCGLLLNMSPKTRDLICQHKKSIAGIAIITPLFFLGRHIDVERNIQRVKFYKK